MNKVKVKPALRLSPLKTEEKEIVSRLKENGVRLEKIPYLKHGYFYTSKFALSSTSEHLLGHLYLQDAASQVPAEVLNPQSEKTVLDMAAAPGGKTTQLSALMKNKGVIVALDVKQKRIISLKNNIERMGCENIIIYNKDASFASDLGMEFDKVLLDAPCSGNFCIEKDWFGKRQISDFNDKATLQKKLLKQAVKVTKKGGIIIYSTCSLEIEENEEVIEWALDNLNVKLENINVPIGEPGLTSSTKKCLRFWPNKTNTQGFFIAKLKKIVQDKSFR